MEKKDDNRIRHIVNMCRYSNGYRRSEGEVMLKAILDFLCFWDCSIDDDNVDREYRKLVREEAKNRGQSEEAFTRELEKG